MCHFCWILEIFGRNQTRGGDHVDIIHDKLCNFPDLIERGVKADCTETHEFNFSLVSSLLVSRMHFT